MRRGGPFLHGPSAGMRRTGPCLRGDASSAQVHSVSIHAKSTADAHYGAVPDASTTYKVLESTS